MQKLRTKKCYKKYQIKTPARLTRMMNFILNSIKSHNQVNQKMKRRRKKKFRKMRINSKKFSKNYKNKKSMKFGLKMNKKKV